MKIKSKLLLALIVFFSLLSIGLNTSCKKTCASRYCEFIYNTNGGEVVESTKYKVGKMVTLPITSKEGYKFIGWYLDEELTNGPIDNIQVEKIESITFYASWEVDTDYLNKIEENKGKDFNNKILTLPIEISLNDEKTLNDLLSEYNRLSDYAKTFVVNYSNLEQALLKIEELKQIKADEETVNIVINAIANLSSELTLEDEALVNNAKALYEELREDLKLQVTNYSNLEQALLKIEELKQIKADEETVNIVINAIANLSSELTLEDEVLVNNAKALYEELREDLKLQVTNYSNLEQALLKIEELKQIFNVAVNKVINEINTIPYVVTYLEKENLERINTLYNNLSDAAKNEITNYNLLEDALNKINEIENDVSNITYVLGEDLFNSREELYEAFFGDFYNFIKNNGGEGTLAYHNVADAKRFLEIGCDFDYGRGGLYGLGDAFGSYFLTKDVNGILEDQPDNKFIGYCYANNMYVDLIPFLITFFAYWRIDEGYASLSNYGADFFAESWAPTVDICKYFYYEVDTLKPYLQTERMIDCFTNCGNVVYGNLPTNINDVTVLPTDLKLRGYTFAGWYDNKEFSGEPITNISDKSKKIILYAKWIEDTESQDLDKAKLVDVYIYNLTTEKAVVNKSTVSKVSNMYNDSSSNAKSQVTNYATLRQLESELADVLTNPLTITFIINNLEQKDFETLKTEFLNDFNKVTSSNITDYNEFINNRYQMMKQLSIFYSNSSMRAKWGFLPTYFVSTNSSTGLTIQSNRVLSNKTGDAEYLSKAIGYFFLRTDSTSDGDVNISFANQNIIDDILINQNKFIVEYTKEKILDVIILDGYDFVGYFDSIDGGNKYTNITDDTPTILYIELTKNNNS